jgi:hypothetical protein
MIAIAKGQLIVWADTIGIPNLTLAEHDLRLTHALAGLYAVPALKDALAFKGGTALNKIYFGKFSRLSVDLDFNLIGPPREVVKQLQRPPKPSRLCSTKEGQMWRQDSLRESCCFESDAASARVVG